MSEIRPATSREIHALSRRRWLQFVASGYGASLLATPDWGWANEVPATKAVGGGDSPLIVRSVNPPNAEPALEKLVANWITPNELFYVRSHAVAPRIDAKSFTLTVSGLVNKPLVLRVGELVERFAMHSAIATLTCAGNRRNELSKIKPIAGVQWEAGAIGNAKWTGVLLSEVLKAAGVQSGAKHVWFEGADDLEHAGQASHFGGSISLEKAMSDTPETPGALLTTQMNGKALLPDHGFPLRAVVPGFIGARSVKWLNRIVVSDRPSANHYLTDAYKLVTDGEASSMAAAPPLFENRVNGAICLPKPGAKLSSGKVKLAGYALPGGKPDCTVTKVEVSTDGGQSWLAAELGEDSTPYCWRLWQAEVPIARKTTEIIARVSDSSGAVQPPRVDWNMKGYMNNGWYHLPVDVGA
jgi:sulfite oxidase